MAAAVGAAAAAAAAPLASTYLAKYSNEEDILNGEYASLYDRYNMGTQAQVLSSLAIKSSAVIPKVYLYLSKVNGKPVIAAFHRPSVYEAHPITITEWDGEAFCFRGDVMPGNHIPMFKFPDQAFERTELQRVPTMAAIDGLVGAMPRNAHYIPAPADGAADTELIRTDGDSGTTCIHPHRTQAASISTTILARAGGSHTERWTGSVVSATVKLAPNGTHGLHRRRRRRRRR